jgi:hypothetical protein
VAFSLDDDLETAGMNFLKQLRLNLIDHRAFQGIAGMDLDFWNAA